MDSYDLIDRFLRNNLDDENYATYSTALDAVYAGQQDGALAAANERYNEADTLMRHYHDLWNEAERDLSAEREVSDKLERALELTLPMAKGYAATNRVGSNAAYCTAADDALSEVAAIRSKGEKA